MTRSYLHICCLITLGITISILVCVVAVIGLILFVKTRYIP